MKNILIVFGVVLLAWYGLSFFDMSSEKTTEEEFNNSGQAKAIEEELQEISLNGLNNYEKIKGRWTSVDDTKSVLDFNDKYKADFYNGVSMNEGPFILYNEYPITKETPEDGNGKYMLSVVGGEQFFYEIVKLDEHNLEMIYLNRGNTLKYSR